MLTLIMAGGRATRLQMGEKGLVRLCNRPLIDYVLDAAGKAGLTPIVVTTPKTPYTANYCRIQGIEQICTSGDGYVEDVIEAVSCLEEEGPVLILCADIPGMRSEHLDFILSRYYAGSAPACSVWIPADILSTQRNKTGFTQEVEGVCAFPVGINILLGSRIAEEQEEMHILVSDHALAFNVNTPSELLRAEEFFSAYHSET